MQRAWDAQAIIYSAPLIISFPSYLNPTTLSYGKKCRNINYGGDVMSARYRVLLLVALSLLAGSTMLAPAIAKDKDDDRCAGSRDVRLVNGKIHTLDAKNSIVSSVTIQNGKIASVGHDGDSSGGPCMQVINLGGRTAIPGLVDNHNHFLLLGLRPGHDTRLETAASIADVQAAIRARSQNREAR